MADRLVPLEFDAKNNRQNYTSLSQTETRVEALKKQNTGCSHTKRLMSIAWLFCLGILSMIIFAGESYAVSDDPDKPWHIYADEITFDQDTESHIARGHVIITKGRTKLTADYTRFNNQTKEVLAEGNVVLTDGEDVLRGDRVEANLAEGIGTLYEGTLFFKERNFYISGDQIKKTGDKTYAAPKACMTTCNGDKPAWKFTGRNTKVTQEGYGTAKHAAFWIKNLPVLYSPYVVFPAKEERQTGLLLPQVGYSSRNGFEYNQPFFWAINDSSDATFYLQYIANRGEKLGLEYRVDLGNSSKGTFQFDYLDDQQIDDGSPESSEDWGFSQDKFPRTNTERYWLRGKHNQSLPFGVNAKLDIDWVSDQDYLLEFRRGITGYYASDIYFENNFGRGFDDDDDPIRANSLKFNRIWSTYALDFFGEWNDNVWARTDLIEKNTTLQTMPFLGITGIKQQILSTPLYYDLNADYINLFREDGTEKLNITGVHRTDVHPTVFLPLRLKNYLTIEPRLGARGTYWNVTDVEDPDLDDTGTHDRFMFDTGARLFTEFYGLFDIDGKSVKRLKHSVRPEVNYDYIPDIDQEDLPNVTGIDRIDEINRITYSLTNTLTTKHLISRRAKKPREKARATSSDVAHDDGKYQYREVVRFFLEQSYDIQEEDTESEEEDQPFSPLFAELEISPSRYFSLKADADWSTYDKELLEHNYYLTLRDRRGDMFRAWYRNELDIKENLNLIADVVLTNKVQGYALYEYDLLNEERVKGGLGVRYSSQCWGVEFSYLDELDEQKYFFRLILLGLGEFGYDYGILSAE
jgi:LPS-assembly protein